VLVQPVGCGFQHRVGQAVGDHFGQQALHRDGVGSGHVQAGGELLRAHIGLNGGNQAGRMTCGPQNVPDKRGGGALSNHIGIALGETLATLNEQELAVVLDDLVSLGVTWIRVDISWSSVQPDSADVYFWDDVDRIMHAANLRNIKVLPILTYTPRWARSGACVYTSKCAPDNPEMFGVFTRAVVKRYAPLGVHAWEIWNEPNLTLFWKPDADPEYYVRLLRVA